MLKFITHRNPLMREPLLRASQRKSAQTGKLEPASEQGLPCHKPRASAKKPASALRRALHLPAKKDSAEAQRLVRAGVAATRQAASGYGSLKAWEEVVEHCKATGYPLRRAMNLRTEGLTSLQWLLDYYDVDALCYLKPKLSYGCYSGGVGHRGNTLGYANFDDGWRGVGLTIGLHDRGYMCYHKQGITCGWGLLTGPNYKYSGDILDNKPSGWGVLQTKGIKHEGMFRLIPDGTPWAPWFTLVGNGPPKQICRC